MRRLRYVRTTVVYANAIFPTDASPVEIALADGSKRKSWLRKWSDLEKDLFILHVSRSII